MIDFTLCSTKKKAYGGANGNKISIIYNDELYMLKLPAHSKLNSNLSYTNSCLSEYLGCHIFNMLGVKAQETILGTYEYHGIKRDVVACKDFTNIKTVVMDFVSIKNKIIDSASNGYGTELYDILDTIHKQDVVDPIKLEEFFGTCLLSMLLLAILIDIMEIGDFCTIKKVMKLKLLQFLIVDQHYILKLAKK